MGPSYGHKSDCLAAYRSSGSTLLRCNRPLRISEASWKLAKCFWKREQCYRKRERRFWDISDRCSSPSRLLGQSGRNLVAPNLLFHLVQKGKGVGSNFLNRCSFPLEQTLKPFSPDDRHSRADPKHE